MVQCHLRPPWWNRRLPFSSFLSLPRRVNRPCRPKPRIIAIESATLYKYIKHCHQHCTSVQSTVTNNVQVYRVYKSLYKCTKHWLEIYFNFSTAESSRAACSHSIVHCFALSPRDVIIFSTLSSTLSPKLSSARWALHWALDWTLHWTYIELDLLRHGRMVFTFPVSFLCLFRLAQGIN